MIGKTSLIGVIDDDEAVTRGLVLNLEHENFKVVTAADGEAGRFSTR